MLVLCLVSVVRPRLLLKTLLREGKGDDSPGPFRGGSLKIRRMSIAAVVVGAMTLSACGGSVGGDSTPSSTPTTSTSAEPTDGSSTETPTGDTSTPTEGSDTATPSDTVDPNAPIADTINIGLEQTPGGYNCNNSASNSVYCAYVDNVTQGAFIRIQPDGTIKPDTEFGTYEKTSDDPLTVKYTFADNAVWSDGTPIDFDDALLAWAAYSGTFLTGKKDDAGNDVSAFDVASTNGWSQVKMPEGKAGDKSFTMVFTDPYADWESLGSGFMPAHIAAEQAGLSSADNGAALVKAIQDKDIDTITKVGAFWSTGWNYQVNLPSLPDVKLLPSSGPYQVDNASDGNLTLKKNPKYWGTPGKTDTLVYKLVDPAEWVQAMSNGDIDAFDPSNPTADVVSQLKAQPDKISYVTGDSLSFSHIDFDSSPQGAFHDIKVRQAFLKCIPRQEMVDKFAKPVYDGAQLLELREFLPAQASYEGILAQVPNAHDYDTVDIPGAKALLDSAGVKQPYDIRFTYAATSSLRADQVQLVKASCDQAGFNIIDTPDPDVFTTLSSRGQWDAAVFGWSGSGLVASGESIYVTGGDQNFGGYSNATVDKVWKEVVRTVDRAKADQMKVALEKELWADPYNAVLYSTPGVAAWSSKVSGPVFNPTQYGISWNAATWTKSAE